MDKLAGRYLQIRIKVFLCSFKIMYNDSNTMRGRNQAVISRLHRARAYKINSLVIKEKLFWGILCLSWEMAGNEGNSLASIYPITLIHPLSVNVCDSTWAHRVTQMSCSLETVFCCFMSWVGPEFSLHHLCP